MSEFVEVSTSDNLYIVTLDDNAIERSELSATIDNLLTTPGIAKENHIYTYSNILFGFSLKSISSEQLVKLQANTLVVDVEEDEITNYFDEEIPESITIKRSINVPDLTPSLKSTGTGPDVYILGTGVNPNHPEFSHTTIDVTGGDGYDCQGYTTGCASRIVGKNLGVVPEATLHSVKYTDCTGRASYSSLIAALNYVCAHIT